MINRNQLKLDINNYVKGKTWYWYVIPWIFGLYIFFKLLSFDITKPLPFIIAVAHSFDFMLHEMAHILTAFLPPLLTAASGSFSELLLGALLIFGAFKTKSYFASLFCFLWFMLACFSVAEYMGDARAQNIELVSLGNGFSSSENVIHDWNFIFSELGILQADTLIANAVWLLGFLSGVIGLGFSLYLIYKFKLNHNTQSSISDKEAELLQNTTLNAGISGPSKQHYKANHKGYIYPDASKGRMATTDDTEDDKTIQN